MFGGSQGKVEPHPFPPCSFLRGAAGRAVSGLFPSTQLRGHEGNTHKLNSQTALAHCWPGPRNTPQENAWP